MKSWQPIHAECRRCGIDDAEVLTDAPDGLCCDGDRVRCDCGAAGGIQCDAETPPHVVWHEEQDK